MPTFQDDTWPADEHNVLIEVYTFSSFSGSGSGLDLVSVAAVEELFTEINSAEPVKAIDMPLEVGFAYYYCCCYCH
jgi:hypothetical protein